MQTQVRIFSKSGSAMQASTKCGYIRLLIKRKLAVPISKSPFTIRLRTNDPKILESLYAETHATENVSVLAMPERISSHSVQCDRSPDKEIRIMTEITDVVIAEDTQVESYRQQIQSQRQEIAQKDAELKRKDAELQGKDGDLRLKDEMLRGKDEQLKHKDELMQAVCAQKDAEIHERDARIRELEAQLKERAV